MGNYKPETKEELEDIIQNKYFKSRKYDLNDIDTSLITDMRGLFREVRHKFDVSKWDTRNVKNMSCMLIGCHSFSQDLSSWNIRGRLCNTMLYNCHTIIKEEWKPRYYNLYEKDK